MSKRPDYINRKFTSREGPEAIALTISTTDFASSCNIDVCFSMSDYGGVTEFKRLFFHSRDTEDFYEAVQFFQTLRKWSEEAVDELTARWLILKEKEQNAKTESGVQEREEDSTEGSDRVDESGAGGLVQEELDFDSETEEDPWELYKVDRYYLG